MADLFFKLSFFFFLMLFYPNVLISCQISLHRQEMELRPSRHMITTHTSLALLEGAELSLTPWRVDKGGRWKALGWFFCMGVTRRPKKRKKTLEVAAAVLLRCGSFFLKLQLLSTDSLSVEHQLGCNEPLLQTRCCRWKEFAEGVQMGERWRCLKPAGLSVWDFEKQSWQSW